MAEPPHLVIFCGAGFSVCAEIPVMSRFTDALRNSGYLGADEQREFDNIIRTCNEMSVSIGESARNLEQLASFLSILKLTRPTFTFPECPNHSTPEKALDLVIRCIRHVARPELDAKDLAKAVAFFSSLHDRARQTFITTNYDLHLELGAIGADKRLEPTPSIRRACKAEHNRSSLYDVDCRFAMRIFKLHGSVNWFRKDDSGGIDVEDELSPSDGEKRLAYTGDFDQLPAFIVPPTILKPEVDKVLAEQFSGASEAIADADHLWFLGYSFPESDSFMQFFLAASLIRNMKIRQIVVVDPDRSVWETRAASMFSAPHLQRDFMGLPFPWEEIEYSWVLRSDYCNAVRSGLVNELRDRLERQQIFRGELPPTRTEQVNVGGRGRLNRFRGR